MVLPVLPALATPPLLTTLDRLLAGETVPNGVEGDIQDGAAATTRAFGVEWGTLLTVLDVDRKSTRLNSSHLPTSRMPSSA